MSIMTIELPNVLVEAIHDQETKIIYFCIAVAEENMRLAAGEPITPQSIPAIADWFRQLLRPAF